MGPLGYMALSVEGPKRRHLNCVMRGSADVAREHLPELLGWIEGLGRVLRERGLDATLRAGRTSTAIGFAGGWERAAKAIAAGTLDLLSVQTERSRATGVRVSLAVMGFTDPLWQGVVRVYLDAEWGGGDSGPTRTPPPAAEAAAPLSEREFVDWCLAGAEASGTAQALLVPHEPPRLVADQTEIERSLLAPLMARAGRHGFGPLALQRFARGAGWGLWLTEQHIAGLGGRDRVAREAPVARVLDRPAGVWLELTDSPWDAPDEALHRLEYFLAPIIPSADQVVAADPPALPPKRPPRVTRADCYPSHAGDPVRPEWLPGRGSAEDDLTLNVHLPRRPAAPAIRAFERLVEAWCADGAEGAFPSDRATDEPGGFHSRTDLEWEAGSSGVVARWSADVGGADIDYARAIVELGRRLAGWTSKYGCPVEAFRVGREAH